MWEKRGKTEKKTLIPDSLSFYINQTIVSFRLSAVSFCTREINSATTYCLKPQNSGSFYSPSLANFPLCCEIVCMGIICLTAIR